MKKNQRIFIGGIVAVVLVCAVIGIGAMSFRGGMMRGELRQGRGVAYAQNQEGGAQATQPQASGKGNNSNGNTNQDKEQGNDRNQVNDGGGNGRGGGRGEPFGIFGAAIKLAGLALFLALIGFGAWLLFFNRNTSNALKGGMTSLIDDLHRRAHQTSDAPAKPSAEVSKPAESEVVIHKPEENPVDSTSL